MNNKVQINLLEILYYVLLLYIYINNSTNLQLINK